MGNKRLLCNRTQELRLTCCVSFANISNFSNEICFICAYTTIYVNHTLHASSCRGIAILLESIKKSMDNGGFDPPTSRMLSVRSTN
jgi:hypothetical protein